MSARTIKARPAKPDWTLSVKVGDVLTNGRSDRVVRECKYGKRGRIRSVTFAIKHCSWTGRCYTVLCINDLLWAAYRPAGHRVKLRSRMDKKIARDLRYENRFNQKLDCCDVRGVA